MTRWQSFFPNFLYLQLLSLTPKTFFCFLIIMVLLLLLPIPYNCLICPSKESWRRQFDLRISPFQLTFLRRMLFRSALFSPILSIISSSFLFSGHFIFSILLYHHNSMLPKCFQSNFPNSQTSKPYYVKLQIQHLTNLSWVHGLSCLSIVIFFAERLFFYGNSSLDFLFYNKYLSLKHFQYI